jgi:serine/threonine protein kinase
MVMRISSFEGNEWNVPQQVRLIPDIGRYTIQAGKEIDTELAKRARRTDQVLWLTDFTPEDGYSSFEGASFEEMPEWKVGREDSVQGVFFGYLALHDEVEVPVAVKPFLSAVTAGTHETVLLMHLSDKSLPVYEVLGVSWSQDQGFALITKFEEESKSLDNVDWRKGIDSPLSNHLTNIQAIEQVGQTLGLLHGNGVIHRDAQIKNFAVNQDKVKLIDLAQARIVYSEDMFVDEVALRSGMFKDLNMVIDSLRDKKFLGDATAPQLAKFIENVVGPAYRSGLFKAHGIVEDHVQTFRGLVEEVLEDTIEQYRV